MSKTLIAIRKSVVMLFSFALIATLLTIVNVGVNESGAPDASAVTTAKADEFEIGYGVGGISPPSPKPNQACRSNCTPTKAAGPAVSSGTFDKTLRAIYYGCTSVVGGNCNVNNVSTRDAEIRSSHCSMTFTRSGRIVAFGGDAAVAYLKASALGGVWSPVGDEEQMFSWLTGYDIGWFWYPVDWSGASGFGYKGRTDSYSVGEYSFYCSEILDINRVSTQKNVVCYPKYDGRPFPYAVGYSVTYKNSNTRYVMGANSYDWVVVGESCVYVNPATPPPKTLERTDICYWNVGHSGYYSQNKAAINSGGTPTSNQPKMVGAIPVEPSISGSNSTAVLNNCTPELNMKVSLSLNDGWAYYRLQGSANYRAYSTYVWDTSWTGGTRQVADIQAGAIQTKTMKAFGTHGCSNPAYQAAPNWASLPTVSFKESDCKRGTAWQCTIPFAPRVNGVSNPIEVMRDGNYLPVQLGGVSITGNGVRDSNSKAVGTVADNNMSYMTQVVNGSSPFSGTNANDAKQYFQLWKNDKGTLSKWDTWLSNPNANKTSYLNFYWSSDNSTSWQMNYKAKINTAEFDVPFQTSTTGAPSSRWRTDTNIDCAGTKVSNAVTVLRSVSTEG